MTTARERELTVVVPVHNGARTLDETLESLRWQTEQVTEVIVVDDGSADESLAVARSHRVGARVIELGTNRGVAFARNTGLLEARTERVAFLDQDDLWHPERARRLMNAFAAHPSLQALVTGERTFALIEERDLLVNGGHPFAGWVTWWPEAARLMADLPEIDVGPEPEIEWVPRARIISGSVTVTTSYVLPRTLSLQVGGFATWARSADDWILLQTLAAHTSIGRLTDQTAFYRVHPSNTSTVTRWPRILLTAAAATRFGGNLVPAGHERDPDEVGRLIGSNLLPHQLAELATESGLRSLADTWALWQLLATDADRSIRSVGGLALAQLRGRLPGPVVDAARRGRRTLRGPRAPDCSNSSRRRMTL